MGSQSPDGAGLTSPDHEGHGSSLSLSSGSPPDCPCLSLSTDNCSVTSTRGAPSLVDTGAPRALPPPLTTEQPQLQPAGLSTSRSAPPSTRGSATLSTSSSAALSRTSNVTLSMNKCVTLFRNNSAIQSRSSSAILLTRRSVRPDTRQSTSSSVPLST